MLPKGYTLLISDKTNKNRLPKAAGFSVTVVLTFIFLFFAFRNVDLAKSFYLISRSSLLVILFYVIVFLFSHYARAVRWKYMLLSVKKDLSNYHLFGSVMVGYGVNCVIPRLGELYRGLFLGRWENISRTTVIGTIVIERIIDITFFIFASLISVSIYSGNLYSEIVWLKPSLVIGFALILIMVIGLIVLIKNQKKFSNVIVRFAGKISSNFAEKVAVIFETLINGLSSIRSFKVIFMILFWSVIILALYALNALVGFYMLGMHSFGEVNFITAWVVMTVSSFGVLIPTPGGTGSYHIISIFALTQLFQFDYEISAAYAILTHFISYLVFVLFTLFIIYSVNKQRTQKGLQKENFFSVFNPNSDTK